MGGIITGPAFTKQFPTINTTTGNGSSTLQGLVVAIYNIGCWAGSLLTMFIGEKLGRKRTVVVGAFVLAVGTVIQCSAFHIPQLMVSIPTYRANDYFSNLDLRLEELLRVLGMGL